MEDLTRSIEESQERLLQESQEKFDAFEEQCEETLESLQEVDKEGLA